VFEDSQVWLIIGVVVGAVAVIVVLGVIANAYITARRLANVLADVEEVVHADLKSLEEKIEKALLKLRIAEAKTHRE
jgi:hypothetical protein